MNLTEFKRQFPNAKPSFIQANLHLFRQAPGAEPEQVVRDEPLAADGGKKGHPTRYRIRIESRRCRLTDPDNLCFKYGIDALRYEGIIEDDTAALLSYEISQTKVHDKKDEVTVIEVWINQ